MEELLDEQISKESTKKEAEKVESEKEKEISLGKFKDVNALLNAYNSLQAEFTKRCQKIKELEGIAENVISPAKSEGELLSDAKSITDEDKENILKEYLKSILESGQKVVFLENDGSIVKSKAEKPKSIDEAGSLAKSIFNN